MNLNNFFIWHSQEGELIYEASQTYVWKTCLRTIVFGYGQGQAPSKTNSSSFELFQGSRAVEFLMEVVCGLKSPMVGETEVFGQYKNFIENLKPSNYEQNEIHKILIEVRNQSKKIRARHLIHLGAQSYGSLLRKKINFSRPIHILGAGQFAEDIIPWLSKKSKNIFIHSRNIEKSKLKKAFAECTHFSLQQPPAPISGYLIVAAPLSADAIRSWLGSHNLEYVFDLRGSSCEDALMLKADSSNLKEFFALINNNKEAIYKKVENAKVNITQFIDEKINEQKLNPFGWDDLCT